MNSLVSHDYYTCKTCSTGIKRKASKAACIYLCMAMSEVGTHYLNEPVHIIAAFTFCLQHSGLKCWL